MSVPSYSAPSQSALAEGLLSPGAPLNSAPSHTPLWREFAAEAGKSFSTEVPAWLASMFFHMALIVFLGLGMMPDYEPLPKVTIQATILPPEVEKLEIKIKKQDFKLVPSDRMEIGSPRTVGVEVEFSKAMAVADRIELPRLKPQVDYLTDFRVPLLTDITLAPTLSARNQIKGIAGDGATGTLGAIDRITQEILRSLERGPVLVVWFFDQSGSMQEQRKTVRDRFDRIYQELGLSKAVDPKKGIDQPLLTSVVAFGQNITFRTKRPTDDLDEIKAAVDGIENDDSGVEMTFNAVGQAAEKFESYRFHKPRRQVMMIVFTDEVGEDENRLEDCVKVCKKNQFPVYVAGVPAPFGRTNIEIKYVDPDPAYDQTPQWIPVRQGPETFVPEQVQLNFTGKRDRDESIYRLDSGFGPYCLTRLCYETNGIFFSVHGNRERIGEFISARDVPVFQARLNYFFDPAVMRPYKPDYLPVDEYLRAVKENKAKLALVETARQSILDPMENPTLVFRKTGEDESSMKQAIDVAQRKAAVLEPRVNNLYNLIRQGEKDRHTLLEPRWRAGFDLAYGRILAVKVRTESYNLMLASAKGGMKLKDPKSNVFTLIPDDVVTTGSTQSTMAKLARDLLTRVAQEHRGTPWAMLAEEELKDPIGWRWEESYDPPPPPPAPRPAVVNPPPPPNRPNNNPPQFRRLPPPKPVRQNIKL